MRVWDVLKKEISSGFGEEINTVRRNRPMTPSLPLNEVKDEFRDLRSLDNDKAARVFNSFFSYGEGDLNNKLSDPFEEDRHEGQLTKDGGTFETSYPWFVENFQIIFGRTVQSFGSRSERSDFLIARGASDDFSNQPGMLFDGHMLDEAVVIDKERAGLRVMF